MEGKRMYKKGLSILLVICLMVYLLPVTVFADDEDNLGGNTLLLGSNNVSVSDESASWYFTPTESGPYHFYSVGNYDSDAALLGNGRTIAYDDNDGNFSIVADLTADVQYELQVSDLNAYDGPEEVTVIVEAYTPILASYTLSPTACTLNGGGFTDGNATKDAIWKIDSYSGGVFTPVANSVSFETSLTGSGRKIYGLSVIYK